MEKKEFEYLEQIVDEYLIDSNNELKKDIFVFTDEYLSNNVLSKSLDSIQSKISSIGFDIPDSISLAQYESIKGLYLKQLIRREADDFEYIFHNDFDSLHTSTRSFMFIAAQITTKFLLSKASSGSVSNIIRILFNNLDGYMLKSLDLRDNITSIPNSEITIKKDIRYLTYNRNATYDISENHILTIYKLISTIAPLANHDYSLKKHSDELMEMLKGILMSTISFLFNLSREHGYIMEFCKQCNEIVLYTAVPITATEAEVSKYCPECYIHYERKDEWKHLDTTNIFRRFNSQG